MRSIRTAFALRMWPGGRGNRQALEIFYLLKTESDLTLRKEYEIRKHEKQFEILDAFFPGTGLVMVGRLSLHYD